MLRRLVPLVGPALLVLAGCFERPDSLLVPNQPFNGSSPSLNALKAAPPATQEAASRVIGISQKLMAANPQVKPWPAFATVGSPTPEVFHVGTSQIVVTEGLVKQCDNEGKLAAVLAMELGKMASEREAQAGLATRNPLREPPARFDIGAEGGGSRGGADLTNLAEQAPYEDARRRQIHPPPPPDPKLLAKLLMQKAGYIDADLDGVEPLLKEAARNAALEKEMAPGTAPRSWTK